RVGPAVDQDGRSGGRPDERGVPLTDVKERDRERRGRSGPEGGGPDKERQDHGDRDEGWAPQTRAGTDQPREKDDGREAADEREQAAGVGGERRERRTSEP